MRTYLFLIAGILFPLFVQAQGKDWRIALSEQLPYLGHRNWIVVTDMAYPMQSKEGITIWYADEPYEEVISYVKQSIDSSPHVYAHVYQDEELSSLNENVCPGITSFKEDFADRFDNVKVMRVAHEQLISKLDSVSKEFQVLIIKTNLTLPYTSTFFELDCKYWRPQK